MHKLEPVEIVLIAIPLLCEVVAVVLFISACSVWCGIIGGIF
jgi:hypothetical protein